MADWTNQDPSTLLPGEPWTSAKALAAFENPVAIAEGAPGAPRIAYTAGTVGSLVFGRGPVATYGALVAGSTIFPTSAVQALNDGGATVNGVFNSGSALSGSWQCLGDSNAGVWGSGTAVGATLWQRVA